MDGCTTRTTRICRPLPLPPPFLWIAPSSYVRGTDADDSPPLSLNRKKRSSSLRRLKPCESNANHISHISPAAAAAPSTSLSPFFVLSRRAEERAE